MKVGIEVEGRFKGIKTLFVDYSELYLNDINIVAYDYGCQQIYISDLDNQLSLNNDLIYIDKNLIVTVERTKVDSLIDSNINIMLHVENEFFWRLRPTDQIKFSKNLNVYSVTKENMTLTIPSDFDLDVTVE